MVESKEYLEKTRNTYLRMVKRYNEDIECMEKTGKDTEGCRVTPKDIEVSKTMRQQRIDKINDILRQIKQYYG